MGGTGPLSRDGLYLLNIGVTERLWSPSYKLWSRRCRTETERNTPNPIFCIRSMSKGRLFLNLFEHLNNDGLREYNYLAFGLADGTTGNRTQGTEDSRVNRLNHGPRRFPVVEESVYLGTPSTRIGVTSSHFDSDPSDVV